VTTLSSTTFYRWFGNGVARQEITRKVGHGVTGDRPQRRREVHPHQQDGRLSSPPSTGHRHPRRKQVWRNDTDLQATSASSRARGDVYDFLTGREFVVANAGARPGSKGRPRAWPRSRGVRGRTPRSRRTPRAAASAVKMASALVNDRACCGRRAVKRDWTRRHAFAQLMDLCDGMATRGRTVLFSFPHLEEVEQLALAHRVVGGPAGSGRGDFRQMPPTDARRPHRYLVRSIDDQPCGPHDRDPSRPASRSTLPRRAAAYRP